MASKLQTATWAIPGYAGPAPTKDFFIERLKRPEAIDRLKGLALDTYHQLHEAHGADWLKKLSENRRTSFAVRPKGNSFTTIGHAEDTSRTKALRRAADPLFADIRDQLDCCPGVPRVSVYSAVDAMTMIVEEGYVPNWRDRFNLVKQVLETKEYSKAQRQGREWGNCSMLHDQSIIIVVNDCVDQHRLLHVLSHEYVHALQYFMGFHGRIVPLCEGHAEAGVRYVLQTGIYAGSEVALTVAHANLTCFLFAYQLLANNTDPDTRDLLELFGASRVDSRIVSQMSSHFLGSSLFALSEAEHPNLVQEVFAGNLQGLG